MEGSRSWILVWYGCVWCCRKSMACGQFILWYWKACRSFCWISRHGISATRVLNRWSYNDAYPLVLYLDIYNCLLYLVLRFSVLDFSVFFSDFDAVQSFFTWLIYFCLYIDLVMIVYVWYFSHDLRPLIFSLIMIFFYCTYKMYYFSWKFFFPEKDFCKTTIGI